MFASTVGLSPAEVLALNATPVQLVPAPGAGRQLIPFGWVAKFTQGGVAYLLGSNCNCYVGDPTNAEDMGIVFGTNMLHSGTDRSCISECVVQDNRDDIAALINQPLTIKATGAAYTSGNGLLVITTFYAIA